MLKNFPGGSPFWFYNFFFQKLPHLSNNKSLKKICLLPFSLSSIQGMTVVSSTVFLISSILPIDKRNIIFKNARVPTLGVPGYFLKFGFLPAPPCGVKGPYFFVLIDIYYVKNNPICDPRCVVLYFGYPGTYIRGTRVFFEIWFSACPPLLGQRTIFLCAYRNLLRKK